MSAFIETEHYEVLRHDEWIEIHVKTGGAIVIELPLLGEFVQLLSEIEDKLGEGEPL
jgi:hypothetical protein